MMCVAMQPGDVFWCTADCGWVTGHTYLAYGPLLVGATQASSCNFQMIYFKILWTIR